MVSRPSTASSMLPGEHHDTTCFRGEDAFPHGSGLMTCMFAWLVRSLDPTGKFADIDHLLRA
jgi:hypothetical protein